MNVMQVEKGEKRWSMIADNIWDMLTGNGGRLPGKLDDEIIKLAKEAGKTFYTGNPQDLYPDALDTFRKEMNEKGWDFGKDDEELFELAMHPQEYRAYKSGAAKKAFEEDVAKRRLEGGGIKFGTAPVATAPAASGNGASGNGASDVSELKPTTMFVDVDGERFKVSVSYGDFVAEGNPVPKAAVAAVAAPVTSQGPVKEILAPLEGKFYLTKESSETPLKVGDSIKVGDLIGYVEAMKTFNAIRSDISGVVVEICSTPGSEIEEDDVMMKIK
jgi:pyruvate carboxylase subunit B